MIKWRLFKSKQHKYNLVLGWVTILWVVLLIWYQKACYNHNINWEPNIEGDSMQLYKQWFRRLVSGLSETSPQILNSLLQSWALQTIPAKHKNPFLNRLLLINLIKTWLGNGPCPRMLKIRSGCNERWSFILVLQSKINF